MRILWTGGNRLAHFSAEPPLAVRDCRSYKRAEQRMRLERFRLEFGVELAAQEPRMVRQFADLDIDSIGSLPGQAQTMAGEDLFVFAVEFVTMAVPLADGIHTVGGAGETTRRQFARISAQTHGPAQFVDAFQLAQLVNHAMLWIGIEFGGVRAREPAHVAGKLDYQRLHAEADPEIRHLIFARVADGVQHAFDAALAKPARNQNGIVALQYTRARGPRQVLSFEPCHFHLALVSQPA